MKTIKYKLPFQEGFKEIECKTEELYNANLAIAEKEAEANTIEINGDFEPAAEPTLEERTAALEEAITLLLEGATE